MQNRSPEKSQIPSEGVKTRKWRLAWEHPDCLPDDHLREAKLSNRLESPDADPQRDPSD